MNRPPITHRTRYCGPCDRLVQGLECPHCGADTDRTRPRLTRQERFEAMADAGCDTWDDYRETR